MQNTMYIKPLNNETSDEYIKRIEYTRGKELKDITSKEIHHIIPKCCGGQNDKNNLIELYREEHYLVHKLLANENPQNDKLQLAWIFMSRNCTIITPEEYQKVREIASKITQGDNNVFSKKNLIKHHGYNKKAIILPTGVLKNQSKPIIFESEQDLEILTGDPSLINRCYNLYEYQEQTGYIIPDNEGAYWWLEKNGLIDDEDD